ncbi:TPA: Lpg0189 family type II secretion system effector [Legionella anisa]
MKKFIFFFIFIIGVNLSWAGSTLSKDIRHYNSVSTHRHVINLSRSKSEMNLQPQKRTIDSPTQIARLKVDLYNTNIECDEVFNKMKSIFVDKLRDNEFTYMITQSCNESTEENKANYYTLSAYFDPQTDEAITYLQQYITDYNGTDFYGVPFKVESAQGVIVSLNVDAGIDDGSDSSIFKTLHHLNNKLYFNNVYDMDETLVYDIDNKIRTNNAELITSFINQWMGIDYSSEVSIYLGSLSDSNQVKISPEFIFLMDTEPKVYAPLIFKPYTHDCTVYPSQKCLG